MTDIKAVILAAGKGTRMKSETTPKVLHQIKGKTLLGYDLDNVKNFVSEEYVIVGHHAQEVENFVKETINTIENKLELSKGSNEDYFTKFDLLSTTFTKYMKENIDLINSKTKEVSDSCSKKLIESLNELNTQIKIQNEEITTNRKMNRSNSQHTKNTITNRLNGHNYN